MPAAFEDAELQWQALLRHRQSRYARAADPAW
jgi:hypothetical protein